MKLAGGGVPRKASKSKTFQRGSQFKASPELVP